MIRIGILGDIGSGKSYVARNFGYPVFNADVEVDKLYKKERKIFNKLKKVLPKYIHTFPINKNEYILEAGLRSGNVGMPEERNRMMVDSICDKLYAPSNDAVENLLNENISIKKIKNVGNIMIDTLVKNYDQIVSKDNFEPSEFSIDRDYFVLTLHRPVNLTDHNLEIIFSGISEFSNKFDVLIPAHPT